MSFNYGESYLESGVPAESNGTRSIRSIYAGSLGLNASSHSLGGNGVAVLSKSASATNNNSSVSRIAQDLLELQRGRRNLNLNQNSNQSFSQNYTFNKSASVANVSYISELETAILRSSNPIEIDEKEEITVNGERGIWANKSEVLSWKGVLPINQYEINQDSRPEIITKKTNQQLEYVQELAIRYLRPPTPPSPGEIIINQLPNEVSPPAPPLIIRQQPARPSTPEPLVIREAPPPLPAQVGRKVITISGKRIPPPPRKVIIERLAPIPPKPQSVIIERWLPYEEVKRKVIFNRAPQVEPVVVKPKNVIVQWEAPEVQIKREYKYLGIIRANPVEYVQRYGSSLTDSRNLPQFVLDIKPPQGVKLASDHRYNSLYELEGDVYALNFLDLEREGLSEYRSYLSKYANSSQNIINASSSYYNFSSNAQTYSSASALPQTDSLDTLIEYIFRSIDRNNNGRISVEDAEKILLRLNSRLDRKYGEDDVRALFNALDVNSDGSIDFQEFKKAFLNLNN